MAPVSVCVCACVQRRHGARPRHTWAIVYSWCPPMAESSQGPEGGRCGDGRSWKSGREGTAAPVAIRMLV